MCNRNVVLCGSRATRLLQVNVGEYRSKCECKYPNCRGAPISTQVQIFKPPASVYLHSDNNTCLLHQCTNSLNIKDISCMVYMLVLVHLTVSFLLDVDHMIFDRGYGCHKYLPFQSFDAECYVISWMEAVEFHCWLLCLTT